MKTVARLAAALAGGFTSCVFASVPSVAPAAPAVDSGAELARVVLSLAAVIALILVVGWFSRRAQGRVRPGGRKIRVIETMPVGIKEKVMLLEVGGTQLLVGASPTGGLRTLHVLETPIVDDTPVAAAPSLRGFRDVLAQWKRGS
ncbi:flagellar protein FliO/FliZ [Luteibacter sp. Sphag1AF]|uniref:flagellar biosynthetic protein FliO n=1 Tax=Luteibacter sp. Sphag1AF TaxID=2587031 RepID=UPI00160F18EB|nr:flagellar biosynthetic protein FliO [Luteibacter sp. Sphag1AF]MBB3225587.1 flagellar protein FliO/FliZ [Luteibacter sp. Sphag1AF]